MLGFLGRLALDLGEDSKLEGWGRFCVLGVSACGLGRHVSGVEQLRERMHDPSMDGLLRLDMFDPQVVLDSCLRHSHSIN